MDTSGVYISATRIKLLSKGQQAFIYSLLTDQEGDPQNISEVQATAEPGNETKEVDGDEHFAELSPGQARDFYAGCGVKTKKAVEAIAASSSRKTIRVSDIAKAVGVEPWELRGVWSGLTRRTNTITGDAQAYLFDWDPGTKKYDGDGNYIDETGEVTELTYNSFRKALKL